MTMLTGKQGASLQVTRDGQTILVSIKKGKEYTVEQLGGEAQVQALIAAHIVEYSAHAKIQGIPKKLKRPSTKLKRAPKE